MDWGRLVGICPEVTDSSGNTVINSEVYKFLNRAQSRMLQRGDWVGSVQVIRMCINNGCVTLPRQVERVDEAMLNCVPLSIYNQWWQFVPPVAPYCGNGQWWGHGPFSWTWGHMEDRGYYATFRDINPGSKKIRIYPNSPNDVGEEVYVQGMDDNNQFLSEDPAYNGIKLTLAMPYVESSVFVSSILGVIKPATEGNLDLYEIDTANGNTRRLLATYEPAEKTVQLRRYRIPCSTTGGCAVCADSESTSNPQTLLALVKIKHLPVSRPTDYLVIENAAAFEEMIRCLDKKDADQPQSAAIAEQDAVRELALEKRNRSPKTQIPVRLRTQGTAQPWKKGVGSMW